MPSEIINISQAKAQLSRLIDDVRKGRQIVMAKAGKPVAMLVPYRPETERRTPGALRGKIRIAGDFDELPDDIARSLGMLDDT